MITLVNVSDAVTVLVRDDSVFEQMKTDHPEILADLVTFKSNPNCTCRAKVFKHFSDKIQATPTSLDKYVKNKEELQKEIDKLYQSRMQNSYSGKMITIQKNEEAWKELGLQASTKAFRSFSVVDNGETLTVYFI